jgi:hypothetical protein
MQTSPEQLRDFQVTSNHKITCLGEEEIDVYDIEVDGNHNFFGNDILVHNSVMFNFNCIAEKYFPNDNDEDRLRKMKAFADGPAANKITEIIQEVCEKLNAFDVGSMKMERESICDAAIFVRKKRYVL